MRRGRERLEDEGVKVGGRTGVASPGGEGLLRVKVGTWTEVRKDPAVRELEKGPGASGVFARPAEDGTLDRAARPGGRGGRLARAGDGLVAATRLRGEAPTWIVTGTDAAGVDAAAAQLQESALEQHFAIARARRRPGALPGAAGAGDAVIHLPRASPLHAARAAVGSAWCVDRRDRRALLRAPARARARCSASCCSAAAAAQRRPPGGAR